MTGDAWLTVAALVAMVVAMATERVPPVMATSGAWAILFLTGVLDEGQAFAGFANSAPATVAALFVVAGAAETTGALVPVTERLLGRASPKSEARDVARVAGPACLASAIMPNTPLVAVGAPRVAAWARRQGRSPARYLLPLSFAAILGGVITLIGTSTNLVVSGMLERAGEEPFGFFEITPVGLPIAVIGAALLAVLAPRLLPTRVAPRDNLADHAREFSLEMVVADQGGVVGRSIEDAGLRHLDGVFLVALERAGGLTEVAVGPNTVLLPGDRLTFVGALDRVLDLQAITGLYSAEHRHLEMLDDAPERRVHEAVIADRSPLIGTTLRDARFRDRHDGAVLAVHRADKRLKGRLGDITLRSGDVLLVLSDPDFALRARRGDELLVVSQTPDGVPPRRNKAWLVHAVLAAIVVTSATNLLSLPKAAIGGALLLMAARVLTVGQARRAVDTNVILVMATSISIGGAVASSGLAQTAADGLVSIAEPLGYVGLLAAVLVATLVLTELVTNAAAASIMVPVALVTAADTAADPRAFAVIVLVGASMSFLSPLGYQTNTMVYSLGGYRYSDFARVGAPLTLTVAVVAVTAVALLYPA